MKTRMALVLASLSMVVMLGAAPAAQIAAPLVPASATATTTAPATPPRPMTPISAREPADMPKQRATSGSWMNQHNRYVEKARKGDIDLYMLGDSITDFWGNPDKNPLRAGDVDNWNKNFSGWKAADFGVSGDLTQHTLWRIQNGELDGVSPKVIVLLIGTNNLPQSSGYTVEQAAKGVKAILDVLTQRQPQAKILLMGIFPRQDYIRTQDVSIMDKVDATNAILATYADGKRIKYMNINEKFVDKYARILPDVTFDWLHPNPKGYQIWADAIRPQLVEWLGPPASSESAPATQGK